MFSSQDVWHPGSLYDMWMLLLWGASIVKWTKKVLRYMKAMIFLVKRL